MGAGAAWILAWLAVGLGLLAVAAAFAGPCQAETGKRELWGVIGAGLLLALVAFCCTFGREYPFEPGGRLGAAVLFGAAAGLLYAAVAAFGRASGASLVAAAQGAALAAVSAAVLYYRGYPDATVLGIPVGMGLTLWWLAAGTDDDARRTAARTGGTAGVITAAILAAGVTLAIERYDGMRRVERLAVGEKVWWVFPLVAGGAVVLGQLVAALVPRRPAAVAAGGAVTLGVLALLVTLIRGGGPTPASGWAVYGSLLLPLAAGSISALLLGAIGSIGNMGCVGRLGSASNRTSTSDTPHTPRTQPTAVVGVLLLLALLAAAYRMPGGAVASAATYPILGGLGLCLAALGFLSAAPWFLSGDERQGTAPAAFTRLFLGAAATIALASLFRLFYVRYDLDESGIRLAAHYVLLGLLAGSALPLTLGIASRAVIGDSAGQLAGRGFLLAALAALAPALLVVFFGIRTGGALIVGMTAGMGLVVLLTMLEPAAEGEAGRAAAAVPVIPVLLSAFFLLLALTPLDYYATHWPRGLRITLATLVALGLAAWAVRTSGRPQQEAGTDG